MDGQSVEVSVKYADWSDKARAGLAPASSEAGLTVTPDGAGGLCVYLERGDRRGLLHIELSGEDARKLGEFLVAQFGKTDGPTRRKRR